MDLISKEGYSFKFDSGRCSACKGFCCRGASGRIWVNRKEMENICRFLNIQPWDALVTHFYKVQGRWSIKEIAREDEWWCLFLDEEIYAARSQILVTQETWITAIGGDHV